MMRAMPVALGLLAAVTGCSVAPPVPPSPWSHEMAQQRRIAAANNYSPYGVSDSMSASLILANYSAVDQLLGTLRDPLDPSKALIVATIVNIDQLYNSSTFGRLISSNVVSRLHQQGLAVLELETKKSLTIGKQGALLLSRELRQLTASHNAQAVIVGTYAISRQTVFVNLAIVDGNVVLGAYDYAVPAHLVSAEMLVQGR